MKWTVPAMGVCLIALLLTGLYLHRQRVHEQRALQRLAEARSSAEEAGLVIDRAAYVEQVPELAPQDNLAHPFIEAAEAMDTQHPLYEVAMSAQVHDREHYDDSRNVHQDEVLAEIEALKASTETVPTPPAAREAMTDLGFDPDAASAPDYTKLSEPMQWAAVRITIAKNADLLEQLAALSVDAAEDARADLGLPWRDLGEQGLERERFEHLNLQRALTRLLRLAAREAAARGDVPMALRYLRAIYLQALAVGRSSHTVSEAGVAGLLFFDAYNATADVMPSVSHPLDPEIERLVRELMVLNQSATDWQREAMEQGWRGELVSVLHFLDNLPNASAEISQEEMKELRPVLPESKAAILDLFRLAMPALQAETLPKAQEQMPELADLASDDAGRFADRFAPLLDRSLLGLFWNGARHSLMSTRLAITLYRNDHNGHLPPSLDALVPDYLPDVPRDPMADDAPIQYDPDRGRLWSVGEDGDDDGGVTADEVRQANPGITNRELVGRFDEVLPLD